MLVRLQIDGFKNLVNFDMEFGAVTCIAGNNGVGKSNIFDAIDFLRRLADETLLDAATAVRSHASKGEPSRLFHFDGKKHVDTMRFAVEMIIPAKGVDDLGQVVEASATFLRYELVLGWRDLRGPDERGGLFIRKEELTHITKGEASKHLRFPHSKNPWRDQVVTGKGTGHRTAAYISTKTNKEGRLEVLLHQDGQGRPLPFLLDPLPRTVLSTAKAGDGPTVTLARKEMRSWAQLQLEPSAMRAPSDFHGSTILAPNGERLAAALYRLATTLEPEQEMPLWSSSGGGPRSLAETRICSAMANRLSELIGDVDRVWVEREEKRQLLTLFTSLRGGGSFPASALSDGTLRFLAMTLIEQDSEFGRLICLEEPENGLHPTRIPSMLDLLYNIAMDPMMAVDFENPDRQVIFNTHSPFVVQNVLATDLVTAVSRPYAVEDGEGKVVRMSSRLEMLCMSGSWRAKLGGATIPIWMQRDYVEPLLREGPDFEGKDLVHGQLQLDFEPAA